MILKNRRVYADCSYQYYSGAIDLSDVCTFDGNYERTIYCVEGSCIVDNLRLNAGDSLEVKNHVFSIYGDAYVFIAQVPSTDNDHYFKYTKAGDHYKVTKPWGYELWINGEHPKYAFKEIVITEGNQCSLQYHNFKEETIYLYEGLATWVYKDDDSINNDDVISDDLAHIPFKSGDFKHVKPKVLHRVKAQTDIKMLEVSTPYLNDVIRVQDDQHRPDGKIESEHK